MTESQQLLADEIVNIFKDSEGIALPSEALLGKIDQQKYKLKDARYLLRLLSYLNILAPTDVSHSSYYLTDKGWAYESYSKYLKDELERKTLDRNLIIFTTRANQISILNAGATILFGLIVTVTTVLTYQREGDKELREILQSKQDSLYRLQQKVRDSLYEKTLFRTVQALQDTSISASTK